MLKVRHHEFWNSHVFHLPVYLYWLYLSLKSRSLFFFSAANPGIETGGLIGESKIKILNKIPQQFLPATIYVKAGAELSVIVQQMEQNNIAFPCIAKPDVGQGGWLVELIEDEVDLRRYVSRMKIPFLIQEYVDKKFEFGILYYRIPGQDRGVISSIARKQLFLVIGDGIRSIRSLIMESTRGINLLRKLTASGKVDLGRVPKWGEVVRLSHAGNHSYGTMFKNEAQLNHENLLKIFDSLSFNIDGFYFGRFDLSCDSIDDLYKGNFKILELNGAGSEPLHIFDPEETLFNAYKSAFAHWRIIYQISQLNKQRSFHFMRFKEALSTYRNVLRIQRLQNTKLTIGN